MGLECRDPKGSNKKCDALWGELVMSLSGYANSSGVGSMIDIIGVIRGVEWKGCPGSHPVERWTRLETGIRLRKVLFKSRTR